LADILATERFTEDIRDIVITKGHEANWALVEMWHAIGVRVIEEYDKPDGLPRRAICNAVAKITNRSERTIDNAVAFARAYPSLSEFPYGDTSWRRVCNDILPEINRKRLTEGKEPLALPEPKPPTDLTMKCDSCGATFIVRCECGQVKRRAR
jgi:hypothetical protein